jgi:hypothetical protein
MLSERGPGTRKGAATVPVLGENLEFPIKSALICGLLLGNTPSRR